MNSKAVPVAGSLNPSLSAAVDNGTLSVDTAAFLQDANDPSTRDLGVDPDTIKTAKVTLAVVLWDDSGSMGGRGTEIITRFNEVLDELKRVQTRNDILLAVTSLWHGVVVPFTRAEQLEHLTERKFNPDGSSTPLFGGIQSTLRLIMDKVGELALAGIPARLVFLVMTDGESTESGFDFAPLAKTVGELDNQKNNKLFGVPFGTSAEASLRQAGFTRFELDLASAFAEFSRATSAAASHE